MIEFTQEVIFKDQTGHITHHFNVGDRIKFISKNDSYFITSAGGIYFYEAIEVS